MRNQFNRRDFIRTAGAGAMAIGLAGKSFQAAGSRSQGSKRIGIIGLDTSHSTAFTKALNDPSAGPQFQGYKVVAAYPQGSRDIQSSVERIPGYTEDVKRMGVEVVGSIDELLQKVDFVLLETNDGRLHLEQAIPVMKAGKRMFIDKPIAASLVDTIAIFDAAGYYKTALFSASSLRYITGAKEIAEGSIGQVIGAEVYSPASLEKTHPDLFWYGIHGVETLFTIMGTGCKTVSRAFTTGTDVVTGIWQDGRIGTMRGIRQGKSGYGGVVYGEKEIRTLGSYAGYDPLLIEIVRFFTTGVLPVRPEETLEIFAFMAAAEESKDKGGAPVQVEKVLEKAKKKAGKINYK